MGVILPGVERDFPPVFFVGLGREEIKVCDAFWKQEIYIYIYIYIFVFYFMNRSSNMQTYLLFKF